MMSFERLEATPQPAQQEDQPVQYEQLDPVQKVRAILAVIEEPTIEDSVLDLSGVDLAALDPQEQERVRAVFAESDVIKSEGEYGTEYKLSEDARSELLKTVSPQSVHSRIAYRLKQEPDFEEDDF